MDDQVESVISVYWPAQSSHPTDIQTHTRQSNIRHYALTLVKELEEVKFVVDPAQPGVLRNEYHGMVECGVRLFDEVEYQYWHRGRKGPAIEYALDAAAEMSIQLVSRLSRHCNTVLKNARRSRTRLRRFGPIVIRLHHPNAWLNLQKQSQALCWLHETIIGTDSE